jgi:ElaB/YqjD/DUF883 family membrane-anchored ribosome-binding protein
MAEAGLENELEQLKSEIANLRADLGAIGESVKRMSTEAVGATQAKVRSAAQDALDEFQSKLNEAKSQSQKAIQNLEREVTENPLTSLAVAFGVGFVLSKILDRGR